MKKTLIVLFSLVTMACLTACNSNASKPSGKHAQEADQKQEAVQEEDYGFGNEESKEAADEKQVLAKSTESDKMSDYSSSLELISIWTYEYNAQGQMLKAIEHPANYQLSDPPAVLGWIEYEYDANGNKVKEWEYEHDNGENTDTLKERDEYEYNEQGKMTKNVHYYVYSDGEESATVNEYEYDAQGNKIKEIMNGALDKAYEYDADGYLTKAMDYNTSDGTVYRSYDYTTEVQEDGYKQTAYDEEGNRCFEYEYNSNKVLTMEAEYRDGNVYMWYDYVYMPNGDISYELLHHAGSAILDEIPEEGYVTRRIEYEYEPLSEVLANGS